MKKLLINIYILLTIIAITTPQLYADKTITTENELLTTILDNALILVQQIKTNIHHEKERTTAVKNIDNTFKRLSSENKHKIKADLNIIKQEAQIFSNARGPLQKYNSANAERSLQNISAIIQKIVVSKTETVVSEAQQELMNAINTTEEIKKEAEIIINQAQTDLLFNRITPVQAAKIIGEQQYIIGASERSLKKESTKAQETVEQTDNQANYLTQFSSHIYNLSTKALAPFKAGYGYTQEEKDIARAIITQLELQLAAITNTYQAAIEQSTDPRERAELQQAFKLMAQHIHNEKHQQQIITGEVMSSNRKLFWTTVGVASALVAGYYFMSPTEEPIASTINNPAQKEQEQPVAEISVSENPAFQKKEEPEQLITENPTSQEEQKLFAAQAIAAAEQVQFEEQQSLLHELNAEAAVAAEKAARDAEEQERLTAQAAAEAAEQVQFEEQQSLLHELNAEAAAAAEKAARDAEEQKRLAAQAAAEAAEQVQFEEQQSLLHELNAEAAAAAEKAARNAEEQERLAAQAAAEAAEQVQFEEQQSLLHELNAEAAAAAEKAAHDAEEQEQLAAQAAAKQKESRIPKAFRQSDWRKKNITNPIREFFGADPFPLNNPEPTQKEK